MPFFWNEISERALLLKVVAECDVKPDTAIWEEVAQIIGGANANACSQRFNKLKREAQQLRKQTEGEAPATPTAAVNKRAAKSTGSNKRKKANPEDNEEVENQESPVATKKAKRASKIQQASPNKTKIQADIDDEDDEDNAAELEDGEITA